MMFHTGQQLLAALLAIAVVLVTGCPYLAALEQQKSDENVHRELYDWFHLLPRRPNAPARPPVSPPVPVKPPVNPPVAPMKPPVVPTPPVNPPVAPTPPVNPPVAPTSPVTPPVAPTPPVTPPVAPTPPVTPPVNPPVAPPVNAPVAGTVVAAAIQAARSDIAALIAQDPNLAAKFVRLTFHDCIGGCDGCVDLSSIENRGLELPINTLQSIAQTYQGNLTRADIWALAGLTAATVAQPTTTPLVFSMNFFNRTTCPNATGGPARVTPSSHISTGGLLQYFGQTFGFNARETVAILGAHTLGRAVLQDSGFDGRGSWDRTNTVLDNGYYRVMLQGGQRIDPNFQLELQSNVAAGRPFPDQFMWRLVAPPPPGTNAAGIIPPGGRTRNLQNPPPPPPGGGAIMLNADMALAVDLNGYLNNTNGAVTCFLPGAANIPAGAPPCPAASTLSVALEYATNNGVWVHDFRDAFTKMTLTGYAAQSCGDVVCPVVPLA